MIRLKSRRVLFTVAATALVGLYSLYQRRERRMDELYARAIGENTVDAKAAVRELGSYRGARSTRMLLAVAEGKMPVPWFDVQVEAVKALASRRDPSVSAALANLLQPHVSLGERQAVAHALQTLPCSSECVAAILHYLERMWAGEPNSEDTVKLLENPRTEFARRAKAYVAREHEELYQALYAVLKRENRLTLEALVQVYGLGTPEPSRFALALVARMRLVEACPALLQSQEGGAGPSSDIRVLPREEIEGTVGSLGCK